MPQTLPSTTESTLPRGRVSFVITDIEGSTALLRRLGEDFAAVVFRHRECVREIASRYGGTLLGHEGDSCFCVFAEAIQALRASCAIQAAMAAEPWPGGARVLLRIGIHTGEAQPCGDTYLALAVHQAARVSAAGHGGQVLLSAQTAAAAQRELAAPLSLRDLGSFRLKDFPHAERLYQLCHPQLRADFPLPRTLSVRRHNLPTSTNAFVGRVDERRRLGELLRERHLVTVVGPGGVGKTRLALEVGSDLLPFFPDGVWLVELVPVGDEAGAVRACAHALGVREEAGRSVIDSVLAFLEGRAALIILDNCEHLLAAASRLAGSLSQVPKLRVLATSREPLRRVGEQLLRMMPLPTQQAGSSEWSEAERLFVERVQEHRPDFRPEPSTRPVVSEICRRLDGMPLALELAASRARALPLNDLALRLRDRFRLLSGGAREPGERQRTLRSTVEWSYEMLSEPERRMFERLSVFADGWDLDAAEFICSSEELPAEGTLDLLTALVDKSLVTYAPNAGDYRYGMLETLREFAAEKLRAAHPVPVQCRLLRWALDLAATAVPRLSGPEGSLWTHRLVLEQDNLAAALEWGHRLAEHACTLRLTALLTHFWIRRGRLSEGAEWADRAAALPGVDPPARAELLIGLGRLLRGSDPARAERVLQEALDLATEDSVRLEALKQLTTSARDRGDYAAAEALLHRQADLLGDLDDPYRRFIVATELATLLLQRGQAAEAVSQLRDRLSEAERQGWRFDQARLTNNLAVGLTELGELDEALHLANEGAEIFRELSSPEGTAHALSTAGMALLLAGAPMAARANFLEVGRIALQVGSSHLGPEALERLAAVELHAGRAAIAARYACAADALYAAVGYQREPADRRLRETLQASLASTLDAPTLARIEQEARLKARTILNEAMQARS